MSIAENLKQWAAARNPLARLFLERSALTDRVRARMPEKTFVRLSDGVTHYELAGPKDGPCAVFVHGLTSPSFIWDYQFHAMAKAGLRVLRYDLFGRGLSDRPRLRYTPDVFDRQLAELLDALRIRHRVDLVTLSMGAAIVLNFMDRHPERVRRYALFGPVGFPVDVPFRYKLAQAPIIGDVVMKLTGNRIFKKALNGQRIPNAARAAELRTHFLAQMQYKGYKRAVLSTSRHTPVLNLQSLYERVGRLKREGLLFWGTEDHITPFAHNELVRAAMPDIVFHPFEGVGHTLNYEHPELVNPILIRFLKRRVQAAADCAA